VRKFLIALAAAGFGLSAAPTLASTAACDTLDSTETFGTFAGCNATGNDSFGDVDAIVTKLFGDEGISINFDGSFAPQAGEQEFGADDPDNNFDIEPNSVNGETHFTFKSLPADTIFVSFKQQNAFELYAVPLAFINGTVSEFELSHHLPGDSTSHISTFAGSGVPQVPLPAAGWMLISGLAGLGLFGRFRKRAA